MKPTCRTSVIVPAWNSAHSLSTTLESVFDQTVSPLQVIVVNDGSDDETVSVVRRYGGRVTLLEQENLGAGAARNAGLARASGLFVAFLDADDFWKPGFLAASERFLDSHPEAVAVSCAHTTRFKHGSERTGPDCVGRAGWDPSGAVLSDFFSFWAVQDHVRTGTVMIRRSVMDEAGGQRADLRISQDLEYWGYLATFGKWGFIPEPLWVGNSRATAHAAGWREKYKERRRLCPSVEAWQARILPRLTEAQMSHFNVVRGRVAAGYAHAKVLGGDQDGARDMVMRYGNAFPQNRVTWLMCSGHRCGIIGWWAACALLRLREALKS
jgi:glycosyltransferase involved in cell wall biosynthesis